MQTQVAAHKSSSAHTGGPELQHHPVPFPPDPNQRHGPEATMHTRVAVWPQDSSSPASRWRCTHWVVAWLSKAAARTPAAMCTSGSGMGPGSIVATHALKLKPLFSRFRSLPNSNSINLALISISMLQIECYQLVVIIRMLVEFFNIQKWSVVVVKYGINLVKIVETLLGGLWRTKTQCTPKKEI